MNFKHKTKKEDELYITRQEKININISKKNYNDKTTFRVIFNFKSIKILLKNNFFKKNSLF